MTAALLKQGRAELQAELGPGNGIVSALRKRPRAPECPPRRAQPAQALPKN